MTALAGTSADTGTGTVEPRRGRPFWLHAAGLLLLLAALVPVVGTDSAFVTDESYVVIQLDTIEETGQWALPHPMPEVDPEGIAFPLHGASRFESGYVPYGKHPTLIYLYLPVHRLFGIVGLVGLSVLGTWAAALLAARLAERLRAGSDIVALWLVGAASPLFFDAYVIHAHTLAAALAVLACLLAVRTIEERRWWLRAGVAVSALGVGLLRTEGVLFAAALGGAIGLFGLHRRRMGLMALGILGLGAGAAAHLLDGAWGAAVARGAPIEINRPETLSAPFVQGRRTSLSYTMLMPGYRGSFAESITLIGAMLIVVGAVVLRRRPNAEAGLMLPLAGAALLLVRSVLLWGPVPGLLVAFCVGVAGLVLLGGPVLRSTEARLLLLTSAVFATAVAMTQYAVGGHTEWGGRYFALAVPLLGAVAAASITQSMGAWPRRTVRALHMALLVAALGLGVLAISTLQSAHERNRERSDGVLTAAAQLPIVDGESPVVVTEDDQIPRLARGRYGEVRFLRVPRPYLRRYLGRLAAEGIEDVLLVSTDPDESLDEVPKAYEQEGPILAHPLQYDDGGGIIRLHLADD